MSRVILVGFMALSYIHQHPDVVTGLKCYECMSQSDSSPCIFQPESYSECDTKYCTIYRKELIDPAGYLVKFYRACQNNPMYHNTIITTSTYKIYYRSCTTNLCNKGDGTDNDHKIDNRISSSSASMNLVPRMKLPSF